MKLFSKILKRENDEYFLVTPVEKVIIKVESEPFITKTIEQKNNPKALAFITNLDEIVIADADHPIKVIEDEKGQPYPTIHIRNNLHALISRSDFYQLVDMSISETSPDSAPLNGKNKTSICSIESNGCKFILGRY